MQPETWNPPITTGTPCRPELAREIKGARKLVRLNPDEPDKSAARQPLSVATPPCTSMTVLHSS